MAAKRNKTDPKSIQLGLYISEKRWVWLEAMVLRGVFRSKNHAVNAAMDMLAKEAPPPFYVPRVVATHMTTRGWKKAAQWLLRRLYRLTDWLEVKITGVSSTPETPTEES